MAEVFKVEGRIDLDASDFHSSIDEAVTEAKKLADSMEVQGEAKLDASGVTQSVSGALKSLSEYKSDVASLAASLRNNGMGASEAWKQAYASIDKSLYDMGKNAEDVFEEMENDGVKASKTISGFFKNAFSFSVGNLISEGVQQGAQYLKEFAKESVSVASSLQEVQNVVDVTFGDGASQLETWAANARTQFGLTELQAKQYASTMGAMLKSMGMAESQVYSMSTAMAGLAADMASFYNLDFDEAFTKIRSGISGETEPLKQLGINLSVANLEAYALSQGITKAYESMTQAEQATIRYNYLLQATADAQGDFARTSDSYANNLRTLQTNIDTLKASIGEKLIPVLNDGITALNKLFGSEQSLTDVFDGADAVFEENAKSIEINNYKAQALIGTLEELSQKENLTEAEAAQWNDAVRRLTAIYPSLSGMIGTTTGELNSSIEAIKNETKALKENALEKAKIAAMQTKTDAWAAAKVELAVLENEAKVADAAWRPVLGELQAVEQQMADVFGMTAADLKVAQAAASLNKESVLDYLDATLEQKAAYNELLPVHEKLVGQEKELSKTSWELNESVKTQSEQVAGLEAEYHELEAAMSDFGVTASGANNAIGGGDGSGGIAGSMTDAAYATSELQTALSELEKESENVQALFDELEQYKLNNFSNIQKKVEGLYGTFDKADKVRKTSAKKMEQGIQSQIEQHQRWQDARKQLEEMGASQELLSEFSFSTEGIAQMEALIKKGPEGIESITGLLETLKAEQNETTTALAETTLAVDTEFQNMTNTAKNAEEDLLKKTETVKQKAAEMAESVTTSADLSEEEISTLQEVGDELGQSVWEPTISAVDYATEVIDLIKRELDTLDGKTFTFYIKGEQKGEEDGSHATGLYHVPFDDYIARLHEGEAVLTKNEADAWRRGKTAKGSMEQPITINVNVNGNANDPYAIADEVKTALELMRWKA